MNHSNLPPGVSNTDIERQAGAFEDIDEAADYDARQREFRDAYQAPPFPSSAIKEYSPTEAALAELRKRFDGVIFDVATTEGDRSARAARKELVTLRTSLETKRKALKAPALEYSRRIDSEAQRITVEIKALEDPIDAQISAVEEARKAETQRKVDEEVARVASHQRCIAAIRFLPADAAIASTATLDRHIELLLALIVDAQYEEFIDQARAAKSETLALLGALRQAAAAREAEAARLVAERAELERLRAEQAERERAERERVAAENERISAEQRAENERQAAARVEIEAREQAQRAEQARLNAQAAALREQEQVRLAAERADFERREREAQALAAEAQRKALDAAEQAADRVRAAAPIMFDALRQWRQAESTNDADELANARHSRDWAISAATGEPINAQGSYVAPDGTMMNADGTRSIFDDVDQ